MKFSERNRIVKARDALQIDSIDDALRNGLWNGVKVHFIDKTGNVYVPHSMYKNLFYSLWNDFFKLPFDEMESYVPNTNLQIKKWFFEADWFEIYDFIEFIAVGIETERFINYCNRIMKRELSGYRFINGIISPIIEDSEITEIDNTLKQAADQQLIGVKIHLENALRLISDRESPDYRNSIKESVSAVESLSKLLSADEKHSLGKALNAIKGKIKIHPALEEGFKKIYGYTSDSDGIRHALTDESTCDFEDAKYMLVSCSAFINYLIEKAEKAGINLRRT